MEEHNNARREIIGLLARASLTDLAACFRKLGELPHPVEIRAPEAGLLMVRGRISGSGAPFNLGEMTVTRCTLSVSGRVGHSLVQGRRPDHARLAAVADALLQLPEWCERLQQHVIHPLQAVENERKSAVQAEAAKTKVDFFTLVRGEDNA